MRRVDCLLRCYKAAFAGLLLTALALVAGIGAAYANPPLGTQLGRLDVGQDVALARAEAALREAGLTPYPAGSSGSRLGINARFTVSIQTMAEGGVTVFSVAVAGSENTSNEEAFQLRDFLVSYLRTGRGPGSSTGGGTPGTGGGGTAPAGGTPVDWGTNAASLNAIEGQRFTLICPPNGSPGRLWGTDIYTADSSIATAAVHTGLINLAAGGSVTIEIRPGQSSYTGSLRNGVTSSDWGPYTQSFVFVRDDRPNVTIQSPWDMNTSTLRSNTGRRYTFNFPPNGTLGKVWGTDVYTDDSSVATAAVHAGLITVAGGGSVTIEIRPGQSSYTGSLRNGVTSGDWGAWVGSFVFVR